MKVNHIQNFEDLFAYRTSILADSRSVLFISPGKYVKVTRTAHVLMQLIRMKPKFTEDV